MQAISRADLPAFQAPPIEDDPIICEERRIAFRIISLAFKEDNKWRLSDGQNQINATIADHGFLERINNNDIAFTKGDILVCRVQVEQWRTLDNLKTEYTILEVLDHQSAARQYLLPLPEPADRPTKKL